MGYDGEELYRCKDLMRSAALLALGIPLSGLNSRGRFYDFLFEDPEKCRVIEQEWWRGTLQVNAVKYADSIKRLKNMVYARKDR